MLHLKNIGYSSKRTKRKTRSRLGPVPGQAMCWRVEPGTVQKNLVDISCSACKRRRKDKQLGNLKRKLVRAGLEHTSNGTPPQSHVNHLME